MARKAKTNKTHHTDPGRLTWRILQVYFVIALILVGLDKFFYMLTDWSAYLSPLALKFCACQDRPFMGVVGLIEIAVGIGVAFKPRIFGYIISLFLLGVFFNLLLTGRYFDIAIRDAGLLLAAFCMAKLSSKYAR